MEKNNWDLEAVLEGKDLQHLYDEWVNINEKILKMVPTFLDNIKNFVEWKKINDKEENISNRLSNYISNKVNEDMSNQEFQAWEQKLDMKGHEFSKKFSGLVNTVLENEEKIRKYISQDPYLKQYERSYELLFKTKKHILDKKENQLISKISINNSAVHSIFSTLTTTDIKFNDVVDGKGKKVELSTMAKVFTLLKSKDRILRKNVWITFNKTYYNFRSTLTKTLYYNYLQLNTYAKLHNFNDYLDSVCFHDEVSQDFILDLYKNVEKFKPIYIKYKEKVKKILAKQLHLKKVEPWDCSIDLCKKKVKYTIEQSWDLILSCFKILGKEYVTNLKKARDENWISYMPKKNKYTGAYSIGEAKGLKKYYILLNFNSSFDSVSTLAHELGHSMNSLYFVSSQPVYADTTIFTAEIPSILNETLLGLYMIEKYKDDKELKNNFINEIVSGFFSTVSRQIIFSNFEYEANKMVNESVPFTEQSLQDLYEKMIFKYSSKTDKKAKKPYSYSLSTIFRISHFYAGNFYVYKYAVGQIVAICLARKIINKEKGILDKFYEFLKSGTSKSPLDTIKILGIDLQDPKIYDECFSFIEDLINQMKI
ncbi:MAG: oligoendopeptidase F [Mycoplasmataceae bacterium]|nr:oligoendopeptidase F [Mycoplasmataceae bacterium]